MIIPVVLALCALGRVLPRRAPERVEHFVHQQIWDSRWRHHARRAQRACPNVPPHPHQHWRVGGKDDYNCKTLPHEPEDYTDEGFECKADCDEGYTWQSGSNKF